MDPENKSLVHVKHVEVWAKNNLEKKYPLIYQKVSMMVLELDYQEKEKQV